MPNNITNRIEFDKAEQFKEVKEFMTGEVFPFDFEKLIPMPESLDLPSSQVTEYAFIYAITDKFKISFNVPITYEKFKAVGIWDYPYQCKKAIEYLETIKDDAEKLKEFEDVAEKALSNWNKYGVLTWYDWAPKNWGTKWNAYDTVIDEEQKTITFDTAWNAPRPVFKELFKKFKLDVTIKSICEGGNFWFIEKYENGLLTSERVRLDEDYEVLLKDLKGWTQEEIDELD